MSLYAALGNKQKFVQFKGADGSFNPKLRRDDD
jgi:hypothetical protein